MDIVLSRILKYLNGCLDDDHMYRIGLFIVHHYVEMCIALDCLLFIIMWRWKIIHCKGSWRKGILVKMRF